MEDSDENLRREDVELPTEDGAVSSDMLRCEDAELDAIVVVSDIVEDCTDAVSLSISSATVEQSWRNCGCWLQTAKKVSLRAKMGQYAISLR